MSVWRITIEQINKHDYKHNANRFIRWVLKVIGANHDHLTNRLICQTKSPKGSRALMNTLVFIADAL